MSYKKLNQSTRPFLLYYKPLHHLVKQQGNGRRQQQKYQVSYDGEEHVGSRVYITECG